MEYNKLREQWLAEESKCIKGWDFSHINGRWSHSSLSWNYKKIVHDFLKEDSVLLDMGTGGGEFLLSLQHPYHLTSVTEGYQPNFDLCQRALAPLGICVKQVINDSELPFENAVFDIVINRHESFDMAEVNRILKPNGVFITQQVGSKNNLSLRNFLLPDFEHPFQNHTLQTNADIVRKHGFGILFQYENFPKTRFYDVGAIVFFAKAIVWEFPGFCVEHSLSQLFKLQKHIHTNGYFETVEHRFIIVAQKSL